MGAQLALPLVFESAVSASGLLAVPCGLYVRLCPDLVCLLYVGPYRGYQGSLS